MNNKLVVSLMIQFFFLGTLNLKCQTQIELEQLESEFQKLFEDSFGGINTWILTEMSPLPYKYLKEENTIKQNDSLRNRITILYIRYADMLTERGFDLDFDYDKINCFRWSVLGADENGSIEKARLQNEDLCKKKSLNHAYERFQDRFGSYYKNIYRKKGLKFGEIKYLVSAYYKAKSQDNIKQVVKMLKMSA